MSNSYTCKKPPLSPVLHRPRPEPVWAILKSADELRDHTKEGTQGRQWHPDTTVLSRTAKLVSWEQELFDITYSYFSWIFPLDSAAIIHVKDSSDHIRAQTQYGHSLLTVHHPLWFSHTHTHTHTRTHTHTHTHANMHTHFECET